jgi:rhodanese-related sulfurtransferase
MTASREPRFSSVLETEAAGPDIAAAHFRARLSFETDASDLHADLDKGRRDILVIDTRSPAAYAEAHLPGAISLPSRRIDATTTRDLPRDRLLVTYCWGPGCNGSTKGALRLSELGFRVKELIGGIEYWQREGYAVETATGDRVDEIAGVPAPPLAEALR